MKNKIFSFFLIFSLVFPLSSAFPFTKHTHEVLNEHIAGNKINQFSLNEYLQIQLGHKAGIKEIFDGKRTEEWITEGGKTEDEPDGLLEILFNRGRANNHFHNPLKTWDRAGLDVFPYAGQSSILWAQNVNQTNGGNWSWHDARANYFEALTGLSKPARESAWARTFRAVGQLMHLVQDASVPAHVRNEIHFGGDYEEWVDRTRMQNGENGLNPYIANPVSFDPEILKGPANPLAPIPIAKIVDTDQYDGSNPDITASPAIGIAEYSNSNFFSEGTISDYRFPSPAVTNAQIIDYSIPDPRDSNATVLRQYYLKKIRDGETGYRLAAVIFAEGHVEEQAPQFGNSGIFSLDKQVYKDYASLLLPRAVGYSSGLLEYFFRGKLQVTAVPIFYKKNLNFVYLKIKNMTPGETLKDGYFALQVLEFGFSQGLGLQFSQQGQGVYRNETTPGYIFTLGNYILVNIHNAFRQAGVAIAEGNLKLWTIDLEQQLTDFSMDDFVFPEYHQYMIVDCIQVIEGKEQ